jgi:hypothetical protein
MNAHFMNGCAYGFTITKISMLGGSKSGDYPSFADGVPQ